MAEGWIVLATCEAVDQGRVDRAAIGLLELQFLVLAAGKREFSRRFFALEFMAIHLFRTGQSRQVECNDLIRSP
jgi:hypothetical protein